MGCKQTIHADTRKQLEELQTSSLRSFKKLHIKELLEVELRPNLSKGVTICTIDEIDGLDGSILVDGLPKKDRGDHVVDVPEGSDVTYAHCVDRVYNKDAWAFPYAFIRVKTAEDVSAVVKFAADKFIALSVMGGANSALSIVSETITVDLHDMRECVYNPHNQCVSVGGGSLTSDLNETLAPHLRSVPCAVHPHLGVSGVTLGGGFGWLSSRDGLACDNLVEVEVVTGEGNIVTATLTNEHADLLVACRGGGGAFGVVTKFVFLTQEVPNNGKFLFGAVISAVPTMKQKTEVLRNYIAMVNQWVKEKKDTDRCAVGVLPAKAPVMSILLTYYGPQEANGKKGLAVVPDIEAATEKMGGLFTCKGYCKENADYYTEIQAALSEHQTSGGFCYQGHVILNDFPEQAITQLIPLLNDEAPNDNSVVLILPFHGNIHNVHPSSSAIASPRPRFMVIIESKWDPSKGPEARAAAALWADKIRNCFGQCVWGESSHPASDVHNNPSQAAPLKTSQIDKLLFAKEFYDPSNVWCFTRRLA